MNKNNNYLKESFESWQAYTESYADFLVDATQQTVAQSLAFRQRMDHLMADTVKKSQALAAQERGVALDLATTFNVQTQVAVEQAAEIFKTVSALMTAPLLTDWAAERAAQMVSASSSGK